HFQSTTPCRSIDHQAAEKPFSSSSPKGLWCTPTSGASKTSSSFAQKRHGLRREQPQPPIYAPPANSESLSSSVSVRTVVLVQCVAIQQTQQPRKHRRHLARLPVATVSLLSSPAGNHTRRPALVNRAFLIPPLSCIPPTVSTHRRCASEIGQGTRIDASGVTVESIACDAIRTGSQLDAHWNLQRAYPRAENQSPASRGESAASESVAPLDATDSPSISVAAYAPSCQLGIPVEFASIRAASLQCSWDDSTRK
ncbi:hypothetical protein BDZ97DRAFT_1766821, partial [Flammula alnicola]